MQTNGGHESQQVSEMLQVLYSVFKSALGNGRDRSGAENYHFRELQKIANDVRNSEKT